MKKLFVCVLATVALISCSGNKNAEFKQEILDNYSGVWVSTKYIQEIEKTKSPAQCYQLLKGVAAMTIDDAGNQDSLIVNISVNNHEGWFFTAYFEEGKTAHSLKTNLPDYDDSTAYYELGCENIDNQRFLFLYHYDKNGELKDKVQYTKVAEKPATSAGNVAWGIEYVVNEKIFAGNYDFNGKMITFNLDGTVSDFDNFKSYYVYTDFALVPLNVADVVCFDLFTPQSKEFVYTFSGDTLHLYEAIPFDPLDNVKAGKLLHTLVRKVQ